MIQAYPFAINFMPNSAMHTDAYTTLRLFLFLIRACADKYNHEQLLLNRDRSGGYC